MTALSSEAPCDALRACVTDTPLPHWETRWKYSSGTVQYEVCAHGNALRLYANGVCHSQWDAAEPFCGSIWDCLSLPVLYRKTDRTLRVLVLGVGGGTVLKQLEQLAPDAELTGLEIDPVHLQVARDWFGVDPVRCELVETDAVAWVNTGNHDRFDLIIDDLFGHATGRPCRSRLLTDDWVRRLRELLSPSGLVVINCLDSEELERGQALFTDQGFRFGVHWSVAASANAIGVFASDPLTDRLWARQLAKVAEAGHLMRSIQRHPLHMR